MKKTPFYVAFLKHFTQLMLLKNQYWCWHCLLSHDMGYCFYLIHCSWSWTLKFLFEHPKEDNIAFLLLETVPHKHSIYHMLIYIAFYQKHVLRLMGLENICILYTIQKQSFFIIIDFRKLFQRWLRGSSVCPYYRIPQFDP